MADDDTKDDVTTDPSSTDPSEDIVTEDTATEAAEEKVEDVKDPEVDSGEKKEEDTGYQFDDDLTSSEPSESSSGQAPATASQGQGGGKYAQELFSKTIHAKFRTFYVDLKESVNGKFVKVSEKSRGRKSTIMMDAEDVPAMVEALQEVQKQL